MRPFSDREKEIIRDKLLRAAEKLFSEQGYSKTNVGELAKAAGIGKGTFYLFYKSKDELVWDLHNELHKKWATEFEGLLATAVTDPETAIKRFLYAAFSIFSHPLVVKLQQTGDLEKIHRAMSHEHMENHGDMSLSGMVPFVEAAQKAGAMVEGDPLVIASTIRAVCFLALHREEIGESTYPAVIETMISLVARGLSK